MITILMYALEATICCKFDVIDLKYSLASTSFS